MSAEDGKHYTKEDMQQAIEAALAQVNSGPLIPHADSEPPRRTLYLDPNFRDELIRISVRAGQVAQQHRDRIEGPIDDHPAAFSKAECKEMIKTVFKEESTKLMAELRLPIGTQEERNKTVDTIKDIIKLKDTFNLSIKTVAGGIVTIITLALATIVGWWVTKGGAK